MERIGYVLNDPPPAGFDFGSGFHTRYQFEIFRLVAQFAADRNSCPVIGLAFANISLALSCPLAFLSYTASRKLLPHPAPEQPAPPAMRRFGWLTLSFLTLAAVQPWLTGGEALIFPSRLALLEEERRAAVS